MAKKELKSIDSDEKKTLEMVQEHQKDSEDYFQTFRDDLDSKESLLIVKLEDQASKTTSSKVFDPRLSTIVFERSARVMSQNPKGKAYAVSGDDVGKSILMNLAMDYYTKNANEQYSWLIKLRMLDLYSLVYGTMFGLVPWRVNGRTDYVGPELLILPIRDCYPQPGVRNLNDADWFTTRTVTTIDWLKSQDDSVWKNIDALDKVLKDNKDGGDFNSANDNDKRSYVERTYYPTMKGDVTYPRVELFTEYQTDRWITWTPQRIDQKTSRPFILREVEAPYLKGKLPIVAKHAFPLIDSPIGLGEFERGKTLQYAINSLINLYLDGVKYSLFPPLAIDPDEVVPSSLKFGPGERWFMNNPGRDVQPININPQGLATFNSTYGFMLSALNNQAGTTDVSSSESVAPSLGKTPEAIKFVAQREGARDEWDRVMMEETIKDIYERFIGLIAEKQEGEVEIRLFDKEIKEIKEQYPQEDIEGLFTQGSGRGSVKVGKGSLDTKYDFYLESGSTLKPNIEAEQSNITSILKAVLENPQIQENFMQQGKMVSLPELFTRWLKTSNLKDYDKIIVDAPNQGALAGAPGQPVVEAAPVIDPSQYQDPEIAQVAAQFAQAGVDNIPAQ